MVLFVTNFEPVFTPMGGWTVSDEVTVYMLLDCGEWEIIA